MRKLLPVVIIAALATAGCARSSVLGRDRPDEMAVTRAAPLVIPPEFALAPPKPGAPRPVEVDSSTQALEALFGGPAARSASERSAVTAAGGRSDPGIRTSVGDPDTTVVDKGQVTSDIIAAPEGDGQDARATTPQ